METIDNTYYYKGNPYRIFAQSKVKIDGIWIDCIIYQCLYLNPDGDLWVRNKEEFFNLFTTEMETTNIEVDRSSTQDNIKKVYISGKITGLSVEEITSKFHNAEVTLSALGVECINPFTAVPYVKGKTWEEYMVDDFRLLLQCDTIYLLDNWQDSKGAKVELAVAKELGLNILYERH